MRVSALGLALALGVADCTVHEVPPAHAPAAKAQRGIVRSGTPDAVNIALARTAGREHAFSWMDLSPEAFAKAKRERKFILLDGAAEWCHWCHVMDETTYADPDVGREIAAHFVAIRVDIDAHPDIAERYGDYGWPATIVLSPDAEELGKYRGYLPKADLVKILHWVSTAAPEVAAQKDVFDIAPPITALPWIAARLVVDMDGYYDGDEGGWGRTQKAPLGQNVAFELRRAAHGDAEAKKRALFTLQKHRSLLDHVWGGIYQYSAGHTWTEPHYEKLMTYQAWNLEGYARAYSATKDAAWLGDARAIAHYLETFLSNADGAFLSSQDADLNAHDAKKAFVDGDVYYRLDDAHRRALGIPRIDDHVYGYENGLAIAAFVSLYEASGDAAVLARARRAADAVSRTLVAADGAVNRTPNGARYLADAANFGYALARLAEVTHDAAYRDAAVHIGETMQRDFADSKTGLLFDRTLDAAAAGVFAQRGHPFPHEITAARFYAALARATGDAGYLERGKKLLAAACTPKALDERGRMLGDVLSTFDELGLIAW